VLIFALDEKNQLISAKNAHKKENYFCRECGGIVRLRAGLHRQRHFFHLGPPDSCRQSQKSLVHLRVQYAIQGLFPLGQCQLERQFPEIGRIADVVWECRKLVFEVQCSSIAREEVEQRNRDYKSLGYNVIWILHDNRFNRWRVKAAEIFLRNSPYYYTNIDSQGRGCIYDQVDVLHGGLRRTFRKIVGVELNEVKELDFPEMNQMCLIPNVLRSRLESWPFHFGKDLIDLWLRSDPEVRSVLTEAYQYERSYYKRAVSPFFVLVKRILNFTLIRPYSIFLKTLLEKSCR